MKYKSELETQLERGIVAVAAQSVSRFSSQD